MAFTSQLYANEPIINDATPFEAFTPPGVGRGLNLSLRGPGDYEYGATAEPFPAELIIPDSEVQARIQEMEETKTRLSDIIRAAQLPHKDQAQTNYCWINAPTHCVEILRLLQNQETVSLSPASVGGPIKNYRNDGGWGKEGLEYIVDHGLVPSANWPDNAQSRSYYTPENNALRVKYRVTEWWELRPRNMRELISCLLRRIPVAGGYNHWSHEVTVTDPVWLDGAAATRIRNSWKGWGDFGFGILQGSKAMADDQVAPRVAIAS